MLAIEDRFIVVTTGYGRMYVSTNSGTTWEITNQRASEDTINGIALLKGGLIVSTKSNGVWLSRDFGKQWLNLGMNTQQIITMCTKDEVIYVGTKAGEVWKTDVRLLTSVIEDRDSQQSYISLSPNPVSGDVVISFDNTAYSNAELDITDIHGRKMIQLSAVNEPRIHVNTCNWLEGIYMVVLRTPRETVSQKLVVLR